MSTKLELAKSFDELVEVLGQVRPSEPLVSVIAGEEHGWNQAVIQLLLDAADPFLSDLDSMPPTTYTRYREFQRNGERRGYETPYFAKRAKMAAAAFALLLGHNAYCDSVHDYLWDICEETTWTIPACEPQLVALFGAGTGFLLAEVVALLGETLADEVSQRVRGEIERRVLAPYLAHHESFWWYEGSNNWSGVCNGAIGSTFLLLEGDVERLARALVLVLAGLEVFFATAFGSEGSSTEGVGYWQYGLSNVIPFAELLRERTGGAIDILGSERLRQIARYPVCVMLSPGCYASYSDCDERVQIAPGLVARLAERTGVTELLDVLARPARLGVAPGITTPPWRHAAWWDGTRPERARIGDEWLRDSGVVRLATSSVSAGTVLLVAKAGHNAENHNQNDVGTFQLHCAGETFLTDPGRGLYSRSYFGPERYENIFCSSFGHSLPVIGGQLQSAGAQFRGEIISCDLEGPYKHVTMGIGDAYEVPELESLTRTLTLGEGGELTCQDVFVLSGMPPAIEEAFVTWLDVAVSGSVATLTGEKHVLELVIEEPADASFVLEVLSQESEANAKDVPLKRLTFSVPPSPTPVARVCARITR